MTDGGTKFAGEFNDLLHKNMIEHRAITPAALELFGDAAVAEQQQLPPRCKTSLGGVRNRARSLDIKPSACPSPYQQHVPHQPHHLASTRHGGALSTGHELAGTFELPGRCHSSIDVARPEAPSLHPHPSQPHPQAALPPKPGTSVMAQRSANSCTGSNPYHAWASPGPSASPDPTANPSPITHTTPRVSSLLHAAAAHRAGGTPAAVTSASRAATPSERLSPASKVRSSLDRAREILQGCRGPTKEHKKQAGDKGSSKAADTVPGRSRASLDRPHAAAHWSTPSTPVHFSRATPDPSQNHSTDSPSLGVSSSATNIPSHGPAHGRGQHRHNMRSAKQDSIAAAQPRFLPGWGSGEAGDLESISEAKDQEACSTLEAIQKDAELDELRSSIFKDSPSSPIFRDNSSSPIFQDSPSSPIFKDLSSSPISRGPPSSPIFKGPSSSSIFKDLPSSSIFRDPLAVTPRASDYSVALSSCCTSPAFSTECNRHSAPTTTSARQKHGPGSPSPHQHPIIHSCPGGINPAPTPTPSAHPLKTQKSSPLFPTPHSHHQQPIEAVHGSMLFAPGGGTVVRQGQPVRTAARRSLHSQPDYSSEDDNHHAPSRTITHTSDSHVSYRATPWSPPHLPPSTPAPVHAATPRGSLDLGRHASPHVHTTMHMRGSLDLSRHASPHVHTTTHMRGSFDLGRHMSPHVHAVMRRGSLDLSRCTSPLTCPGEAEDLQQHASVGSFGGAVGDDHASDDDDDDDMLTPIERESMTTRQQKIWAKVRVTVRQAQIMKANPVAFNEEAALKAEAEAKAAAEHARRRFQDLCAMFVSRAAVSRKGEKVWRLEDSIFMKRAKENDARDVFDTPQVLERQFGMDWARVSSKVRFRKMVTRQDQGLRDAAELERELDEVHDELQKRYTIIRAAFIYFSSFCGSTGSDTFLSMGLMEFHRMTRHCNIADPK
ncbi:hypothetical protein DUNSADRAFT_1968 [Dunaliella salina]|uniref:Uncharacterized protein n=1 Tax=Dunaliella salina TaxID=3046 RepID=A0ABQ7FWS7_DUNSA|nr:hypothetical protein DUNSADRAFT_1968 [Dunaliella salina]|eukprot:KAF5826815.1 hypothetical protein DUNSADRAFT_1968 [Dunaliella salina]